MKFALVGNGKRRLAMGIELPNLPGGFRWERAETGLDIMFGDCRVLTIRMQRAGWMIDLHVADEGQPDGVAAVSEERAIGWATRWVRERPDHLAQKCAGANV